METQPTLQPAIRLLDFKVTKVDLNIKDPNYEQQIEKLKISIGSALGFSEKDSKVFSVGFEVDIENIESDLKIHIKATAIFESKDGLTVDDKNAPLLKSNAPAIAFPFVRSFINTLTTNAGLGSIILPTFRFKNSDK